MMMAKLTALDSAHSKPCATQADLIDAIVQELLNRTGIDFSEHRRTTIERRIANRMISLRSPAYEGYLNTLQASDTEHLALLERVSIKVSRFYRDAEVFDSLRTEIFPFLASLDRPVRIWSAGCGRGEEAWTLAMLLESARIPGTVLVTDLDPTALAYAANATYEANAAIDLPADLRERYLEPVAPAKTVQVRTELHHRLLFHRHDLLGREPLPGPERFDLICCRNVVIYFQRTAQERAFSLLRAQMADRGILCLGATEWPHGRDSNGLIPLNSKMRIFSRVPNSEMK
jgi:chemotaxis methyl-accepting protein methylase